MAVIHAGAGVFVLATIQVLGFVVPMVATARYVKIAHARAQQGVGDTPPGAPV
jgi:hypothetical protein